MTKMMQDDGVAEEDCRGFIDDLQRASRKSFRRAMLQANLLRITANFDNPVFSVSGGKESKSIHESHKELARKNRLSNCAYYPNKGHAWLFSDIDTHIQLLRYFFQDEAFPDKLKGF